MIDHAVTLIGYGKDPKSGDKFYLIQNSWGNSWGEASADVLFFCHVKHSTFTLEPQGGRIRLLRNDVDESQQCGWDRQPEKGILA